MTEVPTSDATDGATANDTSDTALTAETTAAVLPAKSADAAARREPSTALRVLAELAGSFLLCLGIYAFYTVGTAIFGLDMAYLTLSTALIYATVTLLFSPISGAQLNPAVTLAAMLTGRTRPVTGILSIIVQVIGAIGAAASLKFLLPTSDTITNKVWMTPVTNGFGKGAVFNTTLTSVGITFGTTLAIVVELAAGIIIVATAMRTIGRDGRADALHAPAMGLAYGVGAAMAYPVTGAGLNPARSTGIALFARNQGLAVDPLQQLWLFWVCSALAAAIVAFVMIAVQMSRDAADRKAKRLAQEAKRHADADSAADGISAAGTRASGVEPGTSGAIV